MNSLITSYVFDGHCSENFFMDFHTSKDLKSAVNSLIVSSFLLNLRKLKTKTKVLPLDMFNSSLHSSLVRFKSNELSVAYVLIKLIPESKSVNPSSL